MLHHVFSRNPETALPLEAERLVLRRAREADRPALERLQQLDSRRLGGRDVLVAEADGELVAAADPRTGRAIADPFRPTAAVVRMLRSWGAPA